MAAAVQSPGSVELFYSYAHSDESLCQELQKHLAALKRAGLIRDWSDRKIEPGDEWDAGIHAALERAGIILLLVSSDFLASKYIFEVELPFALERHHSGRATVIPVLLRPVEWRDSPIARLQMLPSEARAVTLWPNRDEAFSDVAGRLRELLYNQRLQGSKFIPDATAHVTKDRVLDAAISSLTVVHEPTDLVLLVRSTRSAGLKQILKLDRTYSPTAEEVQSAAFELEFSRNSSGQVLPAALDLVLESPDFDPPRQSKKIKVPPKGDSGVSVFMLTPKRAGILRVNLQILSGGIEVGSRALVTTAGPVALAQAIMSYGVTSLCLNGSGAPMSEPTVIFAPAAGMLLPVPHAPYSLPAEPHSKASPRPLWVGLASSAAALALVCTGVFWTFYSSTPRRSGSTTQASRSPGIDALNAAIKQNPNAPNLYVRRAKAYENAGEIEPALNDMQRATQLSRNSVETQLSYAQLLERAQRKSQALQAYKKVQSLQPSPQVRALAEEHAATLQHQLSGEVHVK